MIPLCRPIIDRRMQEAALDALTNEKLVLGESVLKFEEEFARYIGVDHAVSVSSGTDALFLTLKALDTGSRVFIPAMTFVATYNAVKQAGYNVKIMDVDHNGLMEGADGDPDIVIPVHLHGGVCDIETDAVIIEDACQAHGAALRGRKAGSLGRAGCFSFYPTKNMTVGGDGGMVTTDDDKLAETLRSLRDCGRDRKGEIIMPGYTSRLNTVNAAIGREQLKHLDEWNEERRVLARQYDRQLQGLPITLPHLIFAFRALRDRDRVFHHFTIRSGERDELREFLRAHDIETGIHYPYTIPEVTGFYGYCPKAVTYARTVVSLPMFPSLTRREVTKVCDTIHEFFND